MRTRRFSTRQVLAVFVGVAAMAATAVASSQERAPLGADLSGRWRLNGDLSENAEAKLERMRSQSPGGGGGHMGPRGLFGGSQQAQMEDARAMILDARPSFVLTQDGDRIVITDSSGRIRRLTANGRKEKIDDREVRTRWDNRRLVSEISFGSANVTETYERSAGIPQLIVTTRMDMHGREVSVRRVYDAEDVR